MPIAKLGTELSAQSRVLFISLECTIYYIMLKAVHVQRYIHWYRLLQFTYRIIESLRFLVKKVLYQMHQKCPYN